MDELYLETENGNIKIDQEVIKKFDLKKGTMSPFTNNRIVGKNGEFFFDSPEKKDLKNNELNKGPEDGVVELDNGLILSTAEIIDISEGADSSTE